MIIIEGMDGCGKTTAAKRLAELAGLEYRHMGPPAADFDHIDGYLENVGDFVQDRFHLGEYVYGFLGLSKAGTPEERWEVADVLRHRGVFVIVMYSSSLRWVMNGLEKSDQLYNNAQHPQISMRWTDFVRSQLGTGLIDTAWDASVGFPSDPAMRDWIGRWEKKWKNG